MISAGPSVTRLAEFVNGNPFRQDAFGAFGSPVVRIKQLLDASADFDLAPAPRRPVWITDGDLVFSWSATLAVRFWNRGKALLNQHLFRVDVHPGVDRRWFAYVLEEGVKRLGPLMHGSAMTHITHDMLKSLTVSVPPLSVQRSLADYLDRETARIDALIAAKRRMMELLDERFSTWRDATIEATSAPTVRLGCFVAKITQGVSPDAEDHAAAPNEWAVLKLSAVKGGRYLPSEHKTLAAGYPFRHDLVPTSGDLLVTRSNTPQLVGDVCAVTAPAPNVMLCDLIYRLRLRDELDPAFAAEVLLTRRARHQLAGAARGASQSMVKLRADDIRDVAVPLPPLSLQLTTAREITTMRQTIDRARNCIEEQCALLHEHRQALITAAVTGQLDISRPEPAVPA